MPLLFAATLFVSASLLFMVQPMVGKMILPLLGGSPAVWNSCMVFFQTLLLLGYLYAHSVSTRFAPKTQWGIHTLALVLPVGAMVLSTLIATKHSPIGVAAGLAPGDEVSPFLSVMALLAVAIGIPFFVCSTSAPLLQKWFAYTGHPAARDPYFLYAASNVGSLISLLGYPLIIEPNLTLVQQAWLWAFGFCVLIGLALLCGRAAANPIGIPPGGTLLPGGKVRPTAAVVGSEPPPTAGRIIKWVTQAFVPSSWMLGVTVYMTTDIASIPLLWVVPLALYLITFVIAFSTIVPKWFRLLIGNLAPVMILLLVFTMCAENTIGGFSISVKLLINIATFFAVALMCHYELALDRPRDISHLTAYFLWMSVGGVLGGVFNALAAPMVFPIPKYEYCLVMVIACLMVPRLIGNNEQARVSGGTTQKTKDLDPAFGAGINPIGYLERLFSRQLDREGGIALILDFALPITVGVVFAVMTMFLTESDRFMKFITSIANVVHSATASISALLLYAVPVMVCFFFVDRPFRFALSVAALLLVHLYSDQDPDNIYTERSFFGVLKVEKRGPFTRLVHGTTLHGTQINEYYLVRADSPVPFGSFSPWDVLALEGALQAWDPKQEPLTYYHRTGPVGAMFHELRTRKGGADAKADVAMVGLGTGSVSCYALPGQKLTFYEIDPAVRKIVEDPWMVMNQDEVNKGEPAKLGPFTYVNDARKRGAELNFRMGDARLKLKEDAERNDRKYALLLVDAFSSDSIPIHLLTKEAVELYLNRITEDGLLALHISNKFVRLEPVVARIAKELNLAARVWKDDSESRPGKTASSWVILARDEKTLGVMAAPPTTQIMAFGTKNQAVLELMRKYSLDTPAKDAITREWAGTDLSIDEFTRLHSQQAAVLLERTRRYEAAKEPLTLGELAVQIYGPMFHTLDDHEAVRLWTDDYSDVLQVIMIKEIQWVRRQFGLTTPGLGD